MTLSSDLLDILVQGSEHETSGWWTERLSWSWWGLVLGESQTRPRAENIEHTVEIFSFLREVITAAAVRNSPIISMTFDKEGLIIAFFPNRWKIGFPNMRLSIISVIKPAIIISATIHKFYSNLSTMKASF